MTTKKNSNLDSIDLIIEAWQQQKPDLDAENMALFGRIKRCQILMESKVESFLSQYELHNGAFDVLASLRRAGKPYCLTPTELFSTLMITSGSMTNRLKNLENRDLIQRVPNPNDARSMLVQLTDKGFALIEQALYPHVENEKQILTNLQNDVRQRLEKDLKILEAVLKGFR